MKVMMITGAGISTGSGIATYRGKDGRYTQLKEELGMPVEELLSPTTLRENPALIWKYWIEHMPNMRAAEPSLAHKAIVKISQIADDFLEVTQNVDGLSLKAGLDPEKLIELHGSYHRFVCMECKRECHPVIEKGMSIPPRCFVCNPKQGAVVRPDVVLFGEYIKDRHFSRILDFAAQVDLLVISGTTLMFPYLATFIEAAASRAAQIMYIDPEASPYKSSLLALDSRLEVPERIEVYRETADEGLTHLAKVLMDKQDLSKR